MSEASPFSAALREQRDALGFSLEKLAELANVPVERVSALEQGIQATTREVTKLAEALAVDPAALWRGEVDPTRTTARFRAAGGIASLTGVDARLLARAAEAGRIVAFLRSLLGQPAAPIVAWRRVYSVDPWPAPWEQGYKLGAKARSYIYPNRVPIRSVQHLLEEHGVHIIWSDFESKDVIAASLYEPGAAPVILLNTKSVRARQRLSRRAVLAHELCHILHDGGETDLLTLVSRGTDNAANEQRANAFAPSFLVLGGWTVAHTTDARQLAIDVATEWGLSFEGALWHLKNAQHLSDRDAEHLSLESVTIPEGVFETPLVRRRPEELGLDVKISTFAEGVLCDVALQAYEHDLISRGRAIEILGFQ